MLCTKHERNQRLQIVEGLFLPAFGIQGRAEDHCCFTWLLCVG